MTMTLYRRCRYLLEAYALRRSRYAYAYDEMMIPLREAASVMAEEVRRWQRRFVLLAIAMVVGLGLLLVGCATDTTDAPLPERGYTWTLETAYGPFRLDTVGDYVAGEYCYACLPPVFRHQWCNELGTGPGWQFRRHGAFTDICADSTRSDYRGPLRADSAASTLDVGPWHLDSRNLAAYSFGYVHASGCRDGHLLWTIVDTTGVQHGPSLGADLEAKFGEDRSGAFRLVPDASLPQC